MSQQDRQWHVYALIDPYTRDPFYVGCSSNVKRRLTGHIWESRRGKTQTSAYIRLLVASGTRPQLHILCSGSGDGWELVEKSWIQRYRDEGKPIANKVAGGEGPVLGQNRTITPAYRQMLSWRLIDLAGKRFGRLLVIERDTTKKHDAYWTCRCDCGSSVSARGAELRNGKKVNCGCAPLREQHRQCAGDGGNKGSAEYRAWCYMKTRATNPNAARPSDNYTELGICDRWKKSFKAFLQHLGPKPTPLHSLDRIDVNKGYFPGNVRWATFLEQQNNKRNSRRVTVEGITKTVAEWGRETGLSPYTLYDRLRRGVPPKNFLNKSMAEYARGQE